MSMGINADIWVRGITKLKTTDGKKNWLTIEFENGSELSLFLDQWNAEPGEHPMSRTIELIKALQFQVDDYERVHSVAMSLEPST